MTATDGSTWSTGRLEALRALKARLGPPPEGNPGRIGDQLVAAGELLRRTRAVGVEPSEVESALQQVTKTVLDAWLQEDPCTGVEAALKRALEEGAEAVLGEDAEERQVWSASGFEALLSRDRAESMRVALDRWESLHGAVVAGSESFRGRLVALDERFRKQARWLVGLNDRRRLELGLLDDGDREEAWWFGRRSECDDLLKLLAGLVVADGHPHLAECADCRRDLERSRLVENPPPRHLSSDDAWKMDLGLLSAGERRAIREHADHCKECQQILYAMDEGEKAIEELEREDDVPTSRPAGPRARTRRTVVEDRREFRVVLVRGHGRIRLLVEPREARGFAAATVSLPPQRSVLTPRHTSDGLEFDLGEDKDLEGRTARLLLKITEGGDHFEKSIPL